MSNVNKKLIATTIISILVSGCVLEDDSIISGTNSSTGNVTNLFGVNAVSGEYNALILSATDGYTSTVITNAYVDSSDINAGLINNQGIDDTIDVTVKGVATGSLMIQPSAGGSADLSAYDSGYLEFKIRSTSAVPGDFTVAIDNGWPERKVFSLSGHVNNTSAWEEISVPVNCIQPNLGSGMSDFALDSVGTPFYMESSSSYTFEITDIAFKEQSEFTPVVDAITCL